MIKEFCDKCGDEIPISRQVRDKESGQLYYETVKYLVAVRSSTSIDGEPEWLVSSDVLCVGCMRKGFEVREGDVDL